MDPDKADFFNDLKNLIIDYLKNRLEIARVIAYEKIAKVVAVVFSTLVITFLLFLTILFLSLTAGFYFSNLFENTFYGFGLVAGFYLILFCLLSLFRKALLEKFIINAVIRILFEERNEKKKD